MNFISLGVPEMKGLHKFFNSGREMKINEIILH
jgi:hypothetical protein